MKEYFKQKGSKDQKAYNDQKSKAYFIQRAAAFFRNIYKKNQEKVFDLSTKTLTDIIIENKGFDQDFDLLYDNSIKAHTAPKVQQALAEGYQFFMDRR